MYRAKSDGKNQVVVWDPTILTSARSQLSDATAT